jgi:hypothetical protein
MQDDLARARALVHDMPSSHRMDALLEASLADADGDRHRAATGLERARAQGDQRPQVASLLVRVLLQTERAADAARLTAEIAAQIDPDEARRVAEAAANAGALRPAADLWLRIFEETRAAADAVQAARAFARAGATPEAIAALRHAVASGYAGADAVRGDADFAALRGDPSFEAVLALPPGSTR